MPFNRESVGARGVATWWVLVGAVRSVRPLKCPTFRAESERADSFIFAPHPRTK
jgi:hypothetical protein